MGLKNFVSLKQLTSDKTTTNTASYSPVTATEEIISHDVAVQYQAAAETEQSVSEDIGSSSYPWVFQISQALPIVPGSVILAVGSEYFFDNGEGLLMRSWSTSTGIGIAVGTIDYSTARAVINNYTGRPLNGTVVPKACLVGEDWSVLKSSTFRTSAAPLRPNGFTVRGDDLQTGEQYNGVADNNGDMSGDGVTGTVDLQKGVAELNFPAPVLASSVYYNAVSYKSVPLDPEILGLDPVRLPSNGQVPILRDGDIVVLTHTAKDLVDTPAAGLVVDAGRDKIYSAWFEDEAGTRLATDQYTLDKDAGTATLATPFNAVDADSNALVGNLYFVHRIDDMAFCNEAQLGGNLLFNQPLYHAFPADDTWVASAVPLGNLRARVKDFGCYTTDPGYGGEGIPSGGQYNLVNYPIAIANSGSVPERWKIVFTSTTAFKLYGEHRGQVATGSIAVDFSPINPQTLTPFFTIAADGWGAGWSTGNAVVFETEAAAAPLWLIRTVLPGQATVDDDQLKIELRGDHN